MDQNKIQGKEIAVARAKYGVKEDGKEGYILQTNDGGLLSLVDPLEAESHGVTEDALMDCIDQLEKMGSFEELSKEHNAGHGEERQNAGIVIVSKKDPRIQCSVEFGSNWQKDDDAEFHEEPAADVTLKFFLDVHNEQANKDGWGERAVADEELDIIEMLKTQEESRVMGLLKSGSQKTLIESFDQEQINVMGDHEGFLLGESQGVKKHLSENKGEMAMEGKKEYDVAVDFFGIPTGLTEEDISGYNKSTGYEALKDSELMVDSPQKKQKEVDAKESKLKGEGDPNKAGEAIAKPASELKGDNKEIKEGDLSASEVKVGKPGDDHGKHVKGDGSSDDQQKDLSASDVKVGKPGDDHGKHMEENIDEQIKARMRKRVEEAKARKKIEESKKLAMKKNLSEDEAKPEEKKPEEKVEAEEKPEDKMAEMKKAYEMKMQEAEDLKKKMDDMMKECGEMPAEAPVEAPVEAPAEEPKAEEKEPEGEKKDEGSKVMSDVARKKMQEYMKRKHEAKK